MRRSVHLRFGSFSAVFTTVRGENGEKKGKRSERKGKEGEKQEVVARHSLA